MTALEEIRKLIQNHWTSGNLARDAQGEPVGVHAEVATCWCAQGAIIKAAPTKAYIIHDDLNRLAFRHHGIGLTAVNDHHGQQAVLALLDEAIAEGRTYG